MVERLGAGAVLADLVSGPADPEGLAAGGELPDEFGEVAVIGVAAGFDAEVPDTGVSDPVPVDVELVRALVEEDEAGEVGRPLGVDEDLGVEGVAEPVGGEDVEAAVADERGGSPDRGSTPQLC